MTDIWELAKRHLEEGNFTALQMDLGGPDEFDRTVIGWFDENKFAGEPEILAEALSCACMLGRTKTASYLIDAGVDPYAGMKTGLAGPHYAVSSGRLETLEMLLSKEIALDVPNSYGGDLLGQALWSAVHETKEDHPAIIEALLGAGAAIQPGTIEWWDEQDSGPGPIKQSVANILRSRV